MTLDEEARLIEEERDQQQRTVQLGEYLSERVSGELARTHSSANCLLMVLSLVVTGSGAVLAAGPGHGSLVAVCWLAGSYVLLGVSLLTLLAALRPRLPKPGQTVTGWPTLLASDNERRWNLDAANYEEFLRKDATTLARIAWRKFTLIEIAYTGTMLGLPLLAVGLVCWF